MASVLCGCNQQATIDRFAPHPQTEQARQIIDTLRAGDIVATRASMSDDLQQQDLEPQLRAIVAAFPPTAPGSVKLVGTNTSFQSGRGVTRANYSLTFEYAYPKQSLLVNVVLSGKEHSRLAGIHVQSLDQPLEQANAFTVRDKSPLLLAVVAMACAVPLFCLYAFVRCLLTPIPRRKWLWALFTLLGVMTFRVNWSTGAWDIQWVSVQLFGASAMAPPYGSWIVGVSFPLGAAWFLLRRRQWMTNAPPPPPVPPPSADDDRAEASTGSRR